MQDFLVLILLSTMKQSTEYTDCLINFQLFVYDSLSFCSLAKKKKKKKPFSKAMLLFIQHIYCKHTALYTASLTRFFFKEFTIIFFFKHKSMKFHLLCLELPDRRLSITILCHYEFLVIASLLLYISTYYGYSFLRH